MSFPRYAKYKDSGVKWLGDVPDHWDVKRLAQVGRFLKGSGGSKEDITEDGVSCVRYGDLYTTHSFVIRQSRTRIPQEVAANYTPLHYGDVLFAGSGETFEDIGKSAVSLIEGEAFCGGDLAILRPSIPVVPGFLGFASDSLPSIQQKASMGRGTTVKHIYPDELRHLMIALPPMDEQYTIAQFIQRETAKIDALVAEQRRLIELMKEKRQAIISHAVVKGLNPHARLKSSGVEWLGDVPDHWTTRTIAKASTKITNGYVGPTRDILVETGTPYLQATHIKRGRITFDDGYFVTSEWSHAHEKSILAKGDVLIVQTGAGTGDVAVVTQDEAGFNCHALIIVTSDANVLSGFFLVEVLQSDYGRQVLESIQTGGMHPHLNCGNVKYVEIPLPPTIEQAAIVRTIFAVTERLDVLAAEAERSIDLLLERRIALISAAVTGKIDVRGLAETEAE